MLSAIKVIEGKMEARGLKIAIVASRFNDLVVDRLIAGALDYLHRHGSEAQDLTLIRVPGAFELPVAAKKAALSGKYQGILALGAVIRGGTPHFDYVANECVKGLAQVQLEYAIPVGFGVLTTDNAEQAIERAGLKAGNKGVEAASALVETLRVMEQL